MPVLIMCIVGGLAFLLVFLAACLRETRRNGPRYGLLLQVPRVPESERRRAVSVGRR